MYALRLSCLQGLSCLTACCKLGVNRLPYRRFPFPLSPVPPAPATVDAVEVFSEQGIWADKALSSPTHGKEPLQRYSGQRLKSAQ